MSERKPVAYNGNSPYIFVSYSHKDNAVVYPFILALQEICNVWFDEGIHYGNEWEEEIASKLEGCRIFIYMITPNSLASSNCKDEISFAREMDKNFINVMLNSKTELSKAFRLRYGRYQMCFLDTFPTVEMAVADLARKCKWMEEVAKEGGMLKAFSRQVQEDKPTAPEPRGRSKRPLDMFEIGSIRRAESEPVSRKSRKIASSPALAVAAGIIGADALHRIADAVRGHPPAPGRVSAPSLAETAKECRALANLGDAEAQYRLGTMFENGRGVRFNDEEAQKWYQKAAAQGHSDAQRALARMARRNAETPPPPRAAPAVSVTRQREKPEDCLPKRTSGSSPAKMAKQCRALALEGDAEAQYLLGTMFEKGRGVRFNNEEAKKWYRKAAAQGYAEAWRALQRLE